MKTSLLLTCALICTVQCRNFPKFITQCPRNKDVGLCIKANIEASRPYFEKGIPRLGVPPLNPLVYDKLSLANDRFKMTVSDFKFWNQHNVMVSNFDTTFRDDYYRIKFDFKLPDLKGEGNYEFVGRILFLNINASGKTKLNFDLDGTLVVEGKIDPKTNKVDAKVTDLSIDIPRGNGHFERLFADNEELTNHTAQVINDNFPEFASEIKPIFQDGIRAVFDSIINKLGENYLYDELFPIS